MSNIYSYNAQYNNSSVQCTIALGSNTTVIPESTAISKRKWILRLMITEELLSDFLLRECRTDELFTLLDIWWTYVLDNGPGQTSISTYHFATELSLHSNVEKALSVDIRNPTKEVSWWFHLEWDFGKESIQQDIIRCFGGKPTIVTCSQVLINNLDQYMHQVGLSIDNWSSQLHEQLFTSVRDFLQPGGYLIVNNVSPYGSRDDALPVGLANKTDYFRYLYLDWLTRIYQKPNNL